MIIKYNKIASFDPIETIRSFYQNDLYLKSEQADAYDPNKDYVSYSITGQKLYNAFKIEIESQDFKFNGKWNVSGHLRDKLENIPSMDETYSISSAITEEWCLINLISKLNALSAQLYDNVLSARKLPSYVGQVIVTNSLTSESMVKMVYGGNSWQKIEGRFLLGVGENEKNDIETYGKCLAGEMNVSRAGKMGGAKEVSLKNNNVPGHSHTVADSDGNPMEWGTLPQKKVKMSLKASTSGEAKYGVIGDGAGEHYPQTLYHKNNKGHHGGLNHMTGHHPSSSGNYGDPGSVVSINDITGDGNIDKSFSFTPKATITAACGKNESEVKPHNNVPLYIAEYIWERKS